MFGRTKRGSTVSTLVLALALLLTVFLPDFVAGKPGTPAPGQTSASGAPVRPGLTPASFVDTSTADFSAGTTDAGAYVSETTDGEVILAPAFGSEFSGDSLPASMTSVQWFPPSGSLTIAGGTMTLDGVKAGSIALFGPGHSLEFSARFSGTQLNSSGFGTNFVNPPWAVFRTFLFSTDLLTTTNDGTAQNTALPGPLFNAFHRYRINWTSSNVTYYIDGALVATHTNPPSQDMRPLFSDFSADGSVQVVDWARMSPYATTGVFQSRVFDAGGNARWIDLQAVSQVLENTHVVIETRTGDSPTPDETWSPFAGLSGNLITSPNARYLQYRATLSSDDPSITPALQSVAIDYVAPCSPEICNGIDDDCDDRIDNGTGLCDDHNPCTEDACVDGRCVFRPTPGAPCSDGSECTTADTCNADGQCAGTPVVCNDENPCTADTCEGGQCVFRPAAGGACDDGNPCTDHDTCAGDGHCAGTAVLCDDHNPCTEDACENGQCVSRPTPGAPCSDGNACTDHDACNADGQCAGTPMVCDDQNPCTEDACENGQCVSRPTPGAPCSDGNACTAHDTCTTDGHCAGTPVLCDDHNPCTEDACENGQCVSRPTPGAPCGDGNACTDHDACNADGQCAGTPVVCDDQNPCTADACEGGLCHFVPTPGAECDDGNPCTTGDSCNADGRCVGNGPNCDDQNPCTRDSCDPATGACVHEPTPGAACDDGDACTADDRCVEGEPGGIVCQGTPTDCDDHDACTVDRCEPHGCVVPDNGEGTAELPPQGCSYTSQNDLMILDGLPAGTSIALSGRQGGFSCPTSSTLCSFTPPIPGVDCSQTGGTLGGEQECARSTLSLQLTGSGTLAGFSRTIDLPLEAETQDAPRTPGDPVQTFSTLVFRLTGQITGDPDFDLLRITAGIDFGLPSPGKTMLTQLSGGQWAVDSFFDITYRIDYIGAQGSPLAGLSGSTTGTARFSTGGGQCVHTPVDCDDHNPCTTDRCNPDTGQCEHAAVACDDGNSCTRDFCDPESGACRSVPTPGATCDDGNACTTGDTCNADGRCAGTPVVCNDENNCTRDACVSGQCVFTPTPGATCDDGNACTTDDRCVETSAGAACQGTGRSCDDQNPCTRDSCDPATGGCVHEPTVGATCDDSDACTHDDQCVQTPGNGTVCRGTPTGCDDGNQCTRDSCDPATGQCRHDPLIGTTCDDGNACTTDDTCVGTAAGGPRCEGTARSCDDKNPCTRDSCDAATGECAHTPTPGVACDDGDACTRGDTCNADGRCVGAAVVCNDENSCTRDACVNGQCVFTPTPGAACDDGSACTDHDACNADGRCVGAGISCDDGNPCTDDSCTATAGCVHVNNTAPCSDGNACTTGDVCRDGRCAGGPPPNCDDGNACTADSCNPQTGGCAHAPLVVAQPVCSINPMSLNLGAQGNSFAMNLSVVNACNPGSPSPIPPGSLGIAHVSRAGNTTFPDPASFSCPDADGGTRFETGLFEDRAARSISGNTASLKFDRASDGVCSTLDGNRQDLVAVMTDVPDGSAAQICVTSSFGGQVFQCCTSARVINHGNRK